MKSAVSTLVGSQRVSDGLDRLCRAVLFKQLAKLHNATLIIDDGESHVFGDDSELVGRIEILQPRCYRDIVLGGSIGAAESYVAGEWQSPNLTDVVRVLVRNMDVMDEMEGGLARLTEPMLKGLHWLNKNTLSGSRKNIAAHYDLGNEMFKLFLDPSMMYSCALFTDESMSLEQASVAKLDRICQKLDLQPDDHLVEIGSGWGSMAIHAAQHYGCRVTTTTISQQQYDLAQERIQAAGLEDRITLLLEDYRNLSGQYDKLVSIEMIEAVGHQYYDTYFEACSRLLKPEGLMLIQAITIADHRYERAKQSVDFIKRYIFPGCCIPSVTAIMQSVAKATDMQLRHLEDITPHYVTTLHAWCDAMLANRAQILALGGYDEAFIRLWEFYFCYCAGGFAERSIGDVHMVFAKPYSRHQVA